MPCLLVMDAQDGRIVTSQARRDVEDAYDDEIRGGGKGYLGLLLGEISGWWFGTFFIFPYLGNNHPN